MAIFFTFLGRSENTTFLPNFSKMLRERFFQVGAGGVWSCSRNPLGRGASEGAGWRSANQGRAGAFFWRMARPCDAYGSRVNQFGAIVNHPGIGFAWWGAEFGTIFVANADVLPFL